MNVVRLTMSGRLPLENLGNTCYMNACLQGFLSCDVAMSRLQKDSVRITDFLDILPQGNYKKSIDSFDNNMMISITCSE